MCFLTKIQYLVADRDFYSSPSGCRSKRGGNAEPSNWGLNAGRWGWKEKEKKRFNVTSFSRGIITMGSSNISLWYISFCNHKIYTFFFFFSFQKKKKNRKKGGRESSWSHLSFLIRILHILHDTRGEKRKKQF